MQPIRVYIAVFIAILAILASVFVILKKNKKTVPVTPLSGLAMIAIIAGIVFGESRTAGYSLIALGASLAILDAVRKTRKR